MNCYPAIDLIEGRCVRLTEGEFSTSRTYNIDPVAAAQRFATLGARHLHIVDLDGALSGRPEQAELIGRIARESGLATQSGGGIRSLSDARALLDRRIARVILGSIAIRSPEQAREIIQGVGADRITLGIDVRVDAEGAPLVATEGWRKIEKVTLWEVLDSYCGLGLKHVLCTDIGRDGRLGGPNLALYCQIVSRFPELDLQASGGIAGVDDLRQLAQAGVPSAIIGKALYEGKMSLEEALKC